MVRLSMFILWIVCVRGGFVNYCLEGERIGIDIVVIEEYGNIYFCK